MSRYQKNKRFSSTAPGKTIHAGTKNPRANRKIVMRKQVHKRISGSIRAVVCAASSVVKTLLKKKTTQARVRYPRRLSQSVNTVIPTAKLEMVIWYVSDRIPA